MCQKVNVLMIFFSYIMFKNDSFEKEKTIQVLSLFLFSPPQKKFH